MKKENILPFLMIALFLVYGALGFLFWISKNGKIIDWLKYQFFHRDYLACKVNGGEFKDEFRVPFKLDGDKDGMIKGLTYEQILKKFPFLIDGGLYPKNSYKGEYFEAIKKQELTAKILWFHEKDDFDWCIITSLKGNEIALIKG